MTDENSLARLPVNIGSGLEVKKTRNCDTCRLGYNQLQMINRLMVNGVSYREITNVLIQEAREGRITKSPSYHSVVNHCKNHTRYKERVLREAIDRRAAQNKMDLDADVMSVLTPIGTMEVISKKGFQALVEGQHAPSVAETIQATKFLQEWSKAEDANMDVAALQHQMNILMQSIKEVVPEEYWQPVLDRAEKLLSPE